MSVKWYWFANRATKICSCGSETSLLDRKIWLWIWITIKISLDTCKSFASALTRQTICLRTFILVWISEHDNPNFSANMVPYISLNRQHIRGNSGWKVNWSKIDFLLLRLSQFGSIKGNCHFSVCKNISCL